MTFPSIYGISLEIGSNAIQIMGLPADLIHRYYPVFSDI